jgi:hypothetical protein
VTVTVVSVREGEGGEPNTAWVDGFPQFLSFSVILDVGWDI